MRRPGPLFSVAAFSGADFGEILLRTGAVPRRHVVTSFGKAIDEERSMFLRLAQGRHAVLTKADSQPEIEIGLQRVGWTFFDAELEAVAAFTGIDPASLEKYRNPPIRWASSPPTRDQLQLWQTRVGTAYPYPAMARP
jgi:hypothetical protein